MNRATANELRRAIREDRLPPDWYREKVIELYHVERALDGYADGPEQWAEYIYEDGQQ